MHGHILSTMYLQALLAADRRTECDMEGLGTKVDSLEWEVHQLDT